MSMTGFICHDDYYERLQRLTDEEVGHLFRQLMLYHAGRTDEMTDFIGAEGIAFDFIANDIDRMEEKHNATSETNRINGLKGGRPKKQKEPEKTEDNPIKPTETEDNQTKPYKDKDKDKDKEKNKRFTPPTLEEVTAYCRERNNGIDPAHFVDYYETRNWVLSNGRKCADWRACVRTWEGNKYNGNKSGEKKVVAQRYEQREYTGAESMDDVLNRLAGGARA